MHTLFTNARQPTGAVTTPASFKMTKRRVRKNLIDVIKYNRKQSHAVRSNHLLVRLINAMNLDVNLPLFEYHRMAENRVDRVATSFRLTHSKHRGDVKTEDLFYGNGTEEVVIAVNEDIDLLSIETDWRALQPVKVLAHPYTDLSLIPLDGSRKGHYDRMAVIQIDIVALVIQYRMWVLDQLDRGQAIIRTPMQFVTQYPLTNALASHFDVAMQNRLISLFLGEATEAYENPWPIYLRDMTSEVDDYLFDRIRYLKRKSMVYADIMRSVPLAVKDDLWELNQLPKVPPTRQIVWALTLARAPILRFLVQLDYSVGGQRNYHETNRMDRSMRDMEYDREMMVALPPGRYDDVLDWFKREIGAYL
jgi:hypothetical protein